MAHDASEQFRLRAVAVGAVARRVEVHRFDRGPWRNPERIHPGFLVKDLGDVTAAVQYGEAEGLIFDLCSAAIVEGGLRHYSQRNATIGSTLAARRAGM